MGRIIGRVFKSTKTKKQVDFDKHGKKSNSQKTDEKQFEKENSETGDK